MVILFFYRPKNAWSEEQENELRALFMENQQNPATDEGKLIFLFFLH